MRKFPIEINKLAWSSSKSMKWNTEVQTSGSGKVRTMTNQLLPNWTIETKFAYLTDDEYRKLFGFVALVKGAFEPFLWLDPDDQKETRSALPMVTPGTYQAVMRLGPYVEPVEYIDQVRVYVDGVEQSPTKYTVNNGYIVFKAAPVSTAVVTADYRYWWRVMFKDDGITTERIFEKISKTKSFKLTTVR
ncbi:DUF2460 domain-containing protein [Megasphaera massiliensis]|uniref:DUF2460 domain-containing protein n=1 Tax=Megasphaera massiliensis TaxID=1232428 RepID=UPI00041315DE|nr:DUF2460 domain-containing protein [Megasphaera massiliensis]